MEAYIEMLDVTDEVYDMTFEDLQALREQLCLELPQWLIDEWIKQGQPGSFKVFAMEKLKEWKKACGYKLFSILASHPVDEHELYDMMEEVTDA